MQTLSKSINMVVALILGVVAVAILVSAGPSLVGNMITDVEDSYIENATGCYIDQPAGTVGGDTLVEGFYCTGFGLMPLVIIGLFFAAVIGFVIAIFTGHIKLKM